MSEKKTTTEIEKAGLSRRGFLAPLQSLVQP